jgi:cysteine desulfurase/selenocysteine lyase
MLTSRPDLFEDFEGHIWLNAASEGPLPLKAREALLEAAGWKCRPYYLDVKCFAQTVVDVKHSLGRILGLPWQQIIIGNSATYGIDILVKGLPLTDGDEVLVMENDFPTDILPWLTLCQTGVCVRQLKPQGVVLTALELEQAISKRTQVVCLPHVHTFSGRRLPIGDMIRVCQKHPHIRIVINLSQSLGCFPLDFDLQSVDAIVCAGYKWLCGPYGTGCAWMSDRVLEELEYQPAYWIHEMSSEDLETGGPLTLHVSRTPRSYDMFCTANFFNNIPWRYALDTLSGIGVDELWNHIRAWQDLFAEQLQQTDFKVISSLAETERSGSLYISHQIPDLNKDVHLCLEHNNIHLALWKGFLRVSPHIYNTDRDCQNAIDVLKKFSPA